MTKKKPTPTEATPTPESQNVLVRIPAPLLAALDDLAASRSGPRLPVIVEALERGVAAISGGGIEHGLEQDLAAHTRMRRRLAQALGEVALSEAEASLVCDAMNGVMSLLDYSPATAYSASGYATYLYAEVADAIKLSGLDEKWGVDGRALLRRLRALTPVQAVAICEATALFWRLTDLDTAQALRVVGLLPS